VACGFTPRSVRGVAAGAEPEVRIHLLQRWVNCEPDFLRTRLDNEAFGTWTAGDDVVLEMAMYRAYHRWMADYCGDYPDRLGDGAFFPVGRAM
jgi:hypothetical protein